MINNKSRTEDRRDDLFQAREDQMEDLESGSWIKGLGAND